MATADPKLDGRLDGTYTFATLPAATTVPPGTRAWTSDQNAVISNGTVWLALSSVNLGGADASVQYATPLTGASIQVSAGIKTLIVDPAGTIATLTITTAAAPYDNQPLVVMASHIVTALTLTASAGQTVLGAPSAMAANAGFEYRYKLSNTTWYRVF